MSTEDLTNWLPSSRYVTTNASCRQVELISGDYSGFNFTTSEPVNGSIIQIQDGDGPVGELYIGDYQSMCGTT